MGYREELARLWRAGEFDEAAALVESYTLPLVTSREENFEYHDLAADGSIVASGVFDPAGDEVLIDVDAAFAALGLLRVALLLWVGQPDPPGSLLFDSGGKPLPGVEWHSVASVDGESAWASTSQRRISFRVDPTRPVTWCVGAGIIGGASTVPVAGAARVAVAPHGRHGFVTSPSGGTVTPVALGRPTYSFTHELDPMDRELEPIATGAGATAVAAGERWVVVANDADPVDHVTILDTEGDVFGVVRQVTIDGGRPRGVAVTPAGDLGVLVTAGGVVATVRLPDGEVAQALLPGNPELGDVAVIGRDAALVCDRSNRSLVRVSLPKLDADGSVALPGEPIALDIAEDGIAWVVCRGADASGRLVGVGPDLGLVADHELPFPDPSDIAIMPVAGQTTDLVRTAWVVYAGGWYSQIYVGGPFAGQVHSFHNGSFDDAPGSATGIAMNDYGEIWVARESPGLLYRWLGGRIQIRPGIFFGEYCDVSVYGARR